MQKLNVEFKAVVDGIDKYENMLLALQPQFIGIDEQTDTYFNAAKGRLKLREGNIENALIQYHRPDTATAKTSDVLLYQHIPNPALKAILIEQLGIKVVVTKKRKIYFIKNVKFHLDTVQGLGTFIEVEAIASDGEFTEQQLSEQCNYYFNYFQLNKSSLLSESYSDMLLYNRAD